MSARMRCEFCGTLVAIPDDWPVDWAVCKPCRDWREPIVWNPPAHLSMEDPDDRREAQRSTDEWCNLCGEPFTADEWDDRHTDSYGGDAHARCCDICLCEGR